MEDLELINLWKSYDKKLDENLRFNKQNAEAITKIKIRSFLRSMNPLKLFTLVVGILWVGLGGLIIINLFLFAFPLASKFFLVSASIQLLLTAIAIILYLYQLILINRVNINQPILETQNELVQLKTSTLWVARILILQLPVWTTFHLSEGLIKNGHVVLLLIQFLITAGFCYTSYWLFINIKIENKNKKWFKFLFDGPEWTPIIRSIDLLEEIKEYK